MMFLKRKENKEKKKEKCVVCAYVVAWLLKPLPATPHPIRVLVHVLDVPPPIQPPTLEKE